MSPARRGKLLLWPALGCLLVATFAGGLRRTEPIWEDARALFAPGGAILVLLGVLVWRGYAAWGDLEPEGQRRAAAGNVMLGLAAIGLGLAHVDEATEWRVLTIPAIVGIGLYSLREAARGRRSSLYREVLDWGPWSLAHAGLWLWGLAWPLGVAWALGADLGG